MEAKNKKLKKEDTQNAKNNEYIQALRKKCHKNVSVYIESELAIQIHLPRLAQLVEHLTVDVLLVIRLSLFRLQQ